MLDGANNFKEELPCMWEKIYNRCSKGPVVFGIEPGIGFLQYILSHCIYVTEVCKYSKKSQKSRADCNWGVFRMGSFWDRARNRVIPVQYISIIS